MSAPEQEGQNPFLGLYAAPEALPFDALRAADVAPAFETLLSTARSSLRDLASRDDEPTWASAYGLLEAATEPLEVAMNVVTHLESVRTTPELRQAYNAIKPEVSAFFTSIALDQGLYARLVRLAGSEEGQQLSKDRARALTRTIDDFRRHGAGLSPSDKERLEALSRELSSVTAKFGQNVVDATSAWSLEVENEAELSGLPESAKQAARALAEKEDKPGFILTLHAPSLVPALTHLEDRGLREKIYRAYHGRASFGPLDNAGHVAKILELRRHEAQLLGYPTFAHLVLEPRMAKTPEAARAFVKDLAERCRPAFERETEELLSFQRELEGSDAPPLQPWDVGFYAERLRRARFDFDEEALRPYFSLERVLDGLFQVAERLYGVQIEEEEGRPGWHDDVRTFAVKEGASVLGRFQTDLHPREDKRGGAWMHGLRSGVVTDDGLDRPHLGLFAANLTPPVGGRPALLSHREVITLFHEFGHLLHHLLSKVAVLGQAGTRVAWDFVELPSQIMENWCWEREALDLIARHHETNAPIPDDLFEKMQRARTFRAASAMMRQLGFAELDLALHLDFDPSVEKDVVAYARSILERFSPVPYYEGWAFVLGFTHLFSSSIGYASGYYSYKWAEVLDADAFGRFRAAGIFSPEIGRDFRKHILEPGDSEAPEVLFERFMGRSPRLEALLERDGLLSCEG